MSKKSILLITNIPTPYRISLFNELSKLLDLDGNELIVIFGALGYQRRKWKIDTSDFHFKYSVLKSKKINLLNIEKIILTYTGLYKKIKNENPNILICSGFSLATMKVWLYSIVKNIHYILWSGEIAGRKISFLRKLQRKLICRSASEIIVYGSQASEYLKSLGADPKKIAISMNTVDTEYFCRYTEKLRKKEMHSSSPIYFLCVSNLTPRKQIDVLLLVIKELSRIRDGFVLQIVGDGPEFSHLSSLVKNYEIENYVRFEGFKQKAELPKYFATCRCLLFPSYYDTWGLVLNEAMSAGVPCVASVHAGATEDLIKESITGWKLDFNDLPKSLGLLSFIVDNPEKCVIIGKNAQTFIKKHATIPMAAQSFIKVIKKIN